MALVTIQRSPSPSTDRDLDGIDSSEDASDSKSQLRRRLKTSKEKLRKIFRTLGLISKLRPCLSESYFTIKGAALILPHTECTKKSTKKSHGGEIQSHLEAMFRLIRPEDSIKIAVRLEDTCQYRRYMALISTKGRQDTEEAVILGIDCTSTTAFIGLVLPMWMGLKIKLGGDGGFSLCTDEQSYLFKPVSVQIMWSAIQSLYKVLRIAEDMKYIPEGLTHTWIGYYRSRIDNRDLARICQWNVEGVEVFAPSSLSIKATDESERIKLTISQTLKEVMMTFDLDEATSLMLRNAVEEKMGMSLTEYKSYFDEEVMRIVGQMDKPSKILDFLFLGSEWNASNLDELIEKGIGYILNVTKEIDNFFVGKFQYYNVRVYDVDESDLLRHWDKTYKFISKARSHDSKVLVHCKMGVSRSASTVMAFIMKDQRLTVDEAFQFVKERRSCVHPNSGFMEQLRTYEGILTASNKRDIFRCKSEQSLIDESTKEETELSQGFLLGDSLFHMLSYTDWQSTARGVAYEEEHFRCIHEDAMCSCDILQMETDLETAESRSADSTEDVIPDLPFPASEVATVSCELQTPSALVSPTGRLPVSHSSFGDPSLDKDIQEPEASSDVESYTAFSSSDGSSSLQNRNSLGALGPRIKPDSSWIRLDTMGLEKSTVYLNTLSCADALSCENSYSNCQFNMYALGANKSSGALSQMEVLNFTTDTSGESTGVPATTTVPGLKLASNPQASNLSPDRATIGGKSTGVQFYLGNVQNPVDIKPTEAVSSDIVSRQHIQCPSFSSPATSKLSFGLQKSPDLAAVFCDHLASPEAQVKQISQWELVNKQQKELVEKSPKCRDPSLNRPEACHHFEGEEVPGVCDTCNVTPQSKIELGVRQYFFGEKIPWKPGRVRKIQEDINRTGQISKEEDNEEYWSMDESLKDISEFQADLSDECTLLEQTSEHRPAISLCHSHSCVELCGSMEGDPSPASVYEREEIPLTAGTVLRTRLEIEERQRLYYGEGDQDLIGNTNPVVRTSSLKQEQGIPRSRYTDNRRLTCGPIMSSPFMKSLEDLQSHEVSHDNLATLSSPSRLSPGQTQDSSEELSYNEAVDDSPFILHKGRLEDPQIKAGLVRKHKMELESKYDTDRTQYGRSLVMSTSPGIIKSNVIPISTPPSLLPLDVRSSLRMTDRISADDLDHKQLDSQSSGSVSWRQHETMECFAPEIFIQETCTASLISSSPPKDIEEVGKDEQCVNMVKYFIQKIEKQGVLSSPVRNVVPIDTDIKKATSPSKDESTKNRSSSLSDGANHSNVFNVSESTATSKKITVPADLSPTKPSAGSCIDFSTVLNKGHSEIRQDLDVSEKSSLKNTEAGSSDSSRTSISLKLNCHTILPHQASCQTLENIRNISLSSPLDKAEEQAASLIRTPHLGGPSSPRSSSHIVGHEMPESCVVKHLVGQFENRSPESDKTTSDFSHDHIHKLREMHDISSSLPSARAQKEEHTSLVSSVEDTIQQMIVPSHLRTLGNLQTQSCLSSVTYISPAISSSICSTRSVSPLLKLHKKYVSLDSAQNTIGISKKEHLLNFDIAVELYELSPNSDASSVKETSPLSPSSFSSRKLGPIPFNRTVMEGLEKKTWRSVRPKSTDLIHHSASYSESECSSSSTLHRSDVRDSSYGSFPTIDDDDDDDSTSFPITDDDVSFRQISNEGRKIRRLHGKSQLLTKLSEHRL